MRVIAGSSGGIPLKAPSNGARPTMDKTKGAIFSSLGDLVPGACVLDLYCGSGALGIEALSRGAGSAVFVDSCAKSCACTEENLKRTGLNGGRVFRCDARAYLRRIQGVETFDLVFADPPYAASCRKGETGADLLQSAELLSALGREGLLVFELPSRHDPGLHPGLRVIRERRYGKSAVLYCCAGE